MLMLTVGGFTVPHLALLFLTYAMPSQVMAIEYIHHNVDPSDPAAYGAYHLFPLDTNPGVCTIGVSEVLRRIICKAVVRIGRQDLH